MPYFDRVQRFCFFIAPARSGHSIVAHLLSAHPDVLISDELNALQYFMEGYSAPQVYALIKVQDARFQRRERMKSGYDYSVEGTAQDDENKHPLVIGDAKGEGTSRILSSNPELIDCLRAEVRVPLRVFIQVRHPFDIVATRIRRRGRSLEKAVNAVIEVSRRMDEAASLLRDNERFFQRHEELIADPQGQLEEMFRFLDVEPIPDIVRACAQKIWDAPHLTHKTIDWQPDEQKRLVRALEGSKYFAHYFTR
jgi:hypothetical protein